MRFLPLKYVQDGSVLAKDLYNEKGRILLRRGSVITNKIIRRIDENGIYSVYINDGLSDVELDDVIKPELRTKGIENVRDIFSTLESLGTANDFQKKKLTQEREDGIQKLEVISEEILDEILANKGVMVNLVDIKTKDTYIFQHSTNVATLSLAVGKKLKLNRTDLKQLGIGAILHDIGKSQISKDIIQKENKTEKDKEIIIKEHIKKGYEISKEMAEITGFVRVIILQHHERVDGDGYPNGIKGDKINKLAKIVAVANVYDNLTSDNEDGRAYSPSEAIEYIIANAGIEFDMEVAKAFVDTIVPYPVGSLVELSDGRTAVVKSLNESMLRRPVVQIYNTSTEINLMQKNDVIIARTLYKVPNN